MGNEHKNPVTSVSCQRVHLLSEKVLEGCVIDRKCKIRSREKSFEKYQNVIKRILTSDSYEFEILDVVEQICLLLFWTVHCFCTSVEYVKVVSRDLFTVSFRLRNPLETLICDINM